MTSCKVCWTCHGLFDQDLYASKVKSHIRSCKGSDFIKSCDLFEYFVCSKMDYQALTSLKDCLRQCKTEIFSNVKLRSILPEGILKSLLTLSGYTSTGLSTKQSSQRLDDSSLSVSSQASSKEDYKYSVKTMLTDKSCQTAIYDTRDNNNYKIQTLSLQKAEKVYPLKLKQEQVIATAANCTTDLADSVTTIDVSAKCPDASRNHFQSSVLNGFDVTKVLQQGACEEEKLNAECHLLNVEKEFFYVCKLCSHKTKSDKLMLRHLNSHNDGQPFDCKPCAFSTIWRREWKQHLLMHEKNKVSCSICGLQFWKKEMLDKHMTSVHADIAGAQESNKLCCGECNYVAKNMTVLKEHKRKHTGEVFTCIHEGCEFKSVYERSLQKHLKQKHSEQKSQICWVCGFQTRHASSLSKHMLLRHQEFKPYKCSQCSFKALYPSEVISHAKSKHLKQKRFSCPVCSFQTSYPLAIQKHVERHKGMRGFFCFLCGEVLESAVKIKKHLEEKHGCTDHRIINESTSGKVKPNDYKMDIGQENQLKNSYYVLVMTPEEAEQAENATTEATVNSDITHDIGNDILPAPLEPEPGTAENLLIKSLGSETSLYNDSSHTRKGGNPMLSATTKDLSDMDTSLTEDSLFDLMSDFPRPPGLNRSQSASTLMFASFSPHLIDRPMTPDFFTDSPSVGSIFPNFSTRNLDSESLTLVGNFDGSAQSLHGPSSGVSISASTSSMRGANPPSPVLPSFITSLETGGSGALGAVTMSTSLLKQDMCMDVDSLLPNSVLSGLPQLVSCGSGVSDCPVPKLPGTSFASTNSAFATLTSDFSPEIQAAVASIPLPGETDSTSQPNSSLTEESPFPVNVL